MKLCSISMEVKSYVVRTEKKNNLNAFNYFELNTKSQYSKQHTNIIPEIRNQLSQQRGLEKLRQANFDGLFSCQKEKSHILPATREQRCEHDYFQSIVITLIKCELNRKRLISVKLCNMPCYVALLAIARNYFVMIKFPTRDTLQQLSQFQQIRHRISQKNIEDEFKANLKKYKLKYHCLPFFSVCFFLRLRY